MVLLSSWVITTARNSPGGDFPREDSPLVTSTLSYACKSLCNVRFRTKLEHVAKFLEQTPSIKFH